jgi:cytoskeletal protein CcmA (bactofilin family)
MLENKRGQIMAIVLAFIFLMIITILALSFMMQQDMRLIYRIKERDQARLLAEAGVHAALVKINDEGYPAFPQTDYVTGSLDTGSYNVDLASTGGRDLVTSSGTVSGVTETVSAEIRDDTPTALQYFSGAGTDVRVYSFLAGSDINGDIHANNDVRLMSGPWIASLEITGDVSATGIVVEGTEYITDDTYDNKVYINGFNNDSAVVSEGADPITFPTFKYTDYQQAADAAGDYYTGNRSFTGTLTPTGGVIYVDGDVSITGNCTLNGGLIANNITISGGFFGATLTQNAVAEDKNNVIIAKSGDILIYGRLFTERALLYASQDIRAAQALAEIDVNGIMLAGRDIRMWNFITIIDYNYVSMSPDIEETFSVVSWNK